MSDNKVLIEKLNRITDAWKAQFQAPHEEYWTPSHFDTPPDLPLVWTVADDIPYLDNVWICPAKYIRQNSLDEAPMWVNPVAMEIELDGGTLDIIITKWMGQYSIAGVERTVV